MSTALMVVQLIVQALGPLLKWLLPVIFDVKEKSREAVEIADDPAKYDAVTKYERL